MGKSVNIHEIDFSNVSASLLMMSIGKRKTDKIFFISFNEKSKSFKSVIFDFLVDRQKTTIYNRPNSYRRSRRTEGKHLCLDLGY
jgi:hypothetical protein